MGGCLLTDNLSWASTMFAYTSCPPDPEVVGDRWRDMWHERLRGSGLWLDEWLRHQRRDAYWRHGSICEDFSAIECPVLAVSGWADGYSNSVFRLLVGARRAAQGAGRARGRTSTRTWASPVPPSASCRSSCAGGTAGCGTSTTASWTSRCCGSGCRRACRPSTAYEERPGRWVGEPSWPSPQVHAVAHPLGDHRILRPDREPPADRPEPPRGAVPAVGGPVRRQVVLLQRSARPALRPARGGRRLARVRRRGAHRADGDPRLPGRGARVRRRPAGRDGRGAALRRRHRTAAPPASATAC